MQYFLFRFADFLAESRLLIKLALPIFLAQLALTGLGFIDTLMSGWVGTNDLAAIGLGSSIMLPVFIFSTGVLLALTPLVAKSFGESNPQKISRYFYQGLWLSLPLGLVSLVVLMNLQWVLNLLQLSDVVYQLTGDYLYYIAYGLPGIALYQALRFFWEGLGTTLPTMWISFFALFINIPLNALFIYGYGAIEPMGAAGCGVASAIVMWIMFLMGLLYVFRSPLTRPFIQLGQIWKPSWNVGILPILHLGVPNAMALIFEVSLFSFIALFIAPLGAIVIAGHQVAISFTAMAFMLPLSIGMAITVRVGQASGANSRQAVLTSLYTGVGIAILIGAFLALVTYVFRGGIVALYSHDIQVLQLAASLLIFAAMYQVFDAIQVAAAGALRGLHDTKVTMMVTFISYWGIGLGLGYIMAFTSWVTPAMGVQGFWLGIVLGLLLAAVLLVWRLKRKFHDHFG